MAEPAAAPRPDHAPLGHANDDVNAGAIARLGLALAVVVAISFVVLLWLFHYFSNRESRAGRNVSRTSAEGQLPPAPRLQVSPPTDLEQMLAAENKILSSYGWVDKDKGVTRIPIERAMELIAQRGLPARKNK